MGVQLVKVLEKDEGIRLDRWFSRYYPALKNGQLQRLLRAKNIRVNGKKVTADTRLNIGDEIRIPPLTVSEKTDQPRDLSKADIAFMRDLVIYKDDAVIVLNKPAGLAVQGGSKTERHIDGLLDALRFEKDERPKLVHRLDKDTSGVLVIARTAKAAAKLTEAFKTKEAKKIYWAVVVGVPKLKSGKIDAPLMKKSGAGGGEQVVVDFDHGQKAQTLYHVVDSLSGKAAWVEYMPLTGRTHQLRVHSVVLGTPILGDGKYTPKETPTLGLKDERKMHLHARAIKIPHPVKGMLEISAKIPQHIKNTFDFFGFDEKQAQNGFEFFEHGRN